MHNAILTLCEQQYGVAHVRQLREMGIPKDAIYRRIASLQLHVVHPGVVALGHTVLSEHGRCMAAALACGASGTITHEAAAWLHRTIGTFPGMIDVTATHHRGHIPGLQVHRSGLLDARSTTRIDGIRLTTFARTVVDLGARMSFPLLAHVMYKGSYRRIFDEEEILDELERVGLRRGRRSVLEALELRRSNSAGCRSLSEARMHELLLEIGAPPVLITPDIPTLDRIIEPDFCWPDLQLCIEVDGEQHDTPEGRAADQRRDAALSEAGYRVVRITSTDVWRRPSQVRERVHALLISAGARMRRPLGRKQPR